MKAMLLAAGSGTRLRPLTDSFPKPLAPIANVPLIERTLTLLRDQNVGEVVINLHHHGEMIREALGAGERLGVELLYSVEETLLGTAGALKRAADQFDREEPLYVIYGDNLIDADLRRLRDFHHSRSADVTIALFTPDDPASCGMVELGPDGEVTRFLEKPASGETDATLANAGIYVLSGHMLSALPEGGSDFGKDVFPAWLAEGRKLYAADLGGYLQDTGAPDRYRKANWDVLAGKLRYKPHGQEVAPGCWVAEGVVLDPTAKLMGRNLIADGCVIAADAQLTDCILWSGAAIQSGTRLRNVIVGCDAVVLSGTTAEDTILM